MALSRGFLLLICRPIWRVVAMWDRLPEAAKAGLLALVQAAGGGDG